MSKGVMPDFPVGKSTPKSMVEEGWKYINVPIGFSV
jgi:hypothetical protein